MDQLLVCQLRWYLATAPPWTTDCRKDVLQ